MDIGHRTSDIGHRTSDIGQKWKRDADRRKLVSSENFVVRPPGETARGFLSCGVDSR